MSKTSRTTKSLDINESELLDEFDSRDELIIETETETESEPEAAEKRTVKLKEGWYRDKKCFAATPHRILQELNKDILGQEEAKKDIALAVSNHINSYYIEDEMPQNNVIIVGDTGSGKTLMMETVRKIVQQFDIELAIADATKITDDGFQGLSTESVLHQLYNRCDENREKAERSIIYIDEIDKLLFDPKFPEGRVGVFNSFLKIIEGADFCVSRNSNDSETFNINSSKILFIVGGVFAGIDKLKKEEVKQTIGFNSDIEKTEAVRKEKITPSDLIDIGMPREFIGRFDIITRLAPMTECTMHRILTEKKIPMYEKLFAMQGESLKLSDEKIDEIVKDAVNSKSGARGLNNTLVRMLCDNVFAEEVRKDVLSDNKNTTAFRKITDLI